MSEELKQTEGKLAYELEWEFIEDMAKRMQKNKGKYAPYSWRNPIEIGKLKDALMRHTIEIMKGNYEDDGDVLGHLEAVAVNSMIISYQLKNNQKS